MGVDIDQLIFDSWHRVGQLEQKPARLACHNHARSHRRTDDDLHTHLVLALGHAQILHCGSAQPGAVRAENAYAAYECSQIYKCLHYFPWHDSGTRSRA